MNHSRFPDPRQYGDVVALGGHLTLDYLIDAYHHGIFPWPMEGADRMSWFCPEERAVLFFKDLHLPRSLAKVRRRAPFRFTVDRAFEQVIVRCAETKRPGQPGTWITPEVIDGYADLHRVGRAHSVEAWEGDSLVGGVYGVDADGSFGAESMFFEKDYASKLALLHLIEHLESRGSVWLDIQVMTPHMEALGAVTIGRDEFLRRLSREQSRGLRLF